MWNDGTGADTLMTYSKVQPKFQELFTAVAINSTKDVYIIDAPSATTHNMGTAASFVGKIVYILNASANHTVTLDGFGTQTIGGTQTYALTPGQGITITGQTNDSDIKILATN